MERRSTRCIKRKKFADEVIDSAPHTKLIRRTSVVNAKSRDKHSEELIAKKVKSPEITRNFSFVKWKAEDDLALVLEDTHRLVRFSSAFTLPEIEQRWHSLLYSKYVMNTSKIAISKLSKTVITKIRNSSPLSAAEIKILNTFVTNNNPTIEQCNQVLEQNASTFLFGRTPESILKYYKKESTKKFSEDEHDLCTFSDLEEKLSDIDSFDDEVQEDIKQSDCADKQSIRILENELIHWQQMASSATGLMFADFDNQTLAILRGQQVRYLMRSKEVTFGRSCKRYNVDIDLSLEGNAIKVSRKQGSICLNSDGHFLITNYGQHSIFVDGKPLLQDEETILTHQSIIEVNTKKIFLE